mmetsp:Transcript_24936/g.58512  ORF Transcript_24936/g.58512 Transcript_24936/m.58512 type:complete len:311 (+) Transcript_24936:69-1001(+)
MFFLHSLLVRLSFEGDGGEGRRSRKARWPSRCSRRLVDPQPEGPGKQPEIVGPERVPDLLPAEGPVLVGVEGVEHRRDVLAGLTDGGGLRARRGELVGDPPEVIGELVLGDAPAAVCVDEIEDEVGEVVQEPPLLVVAVALLRQELLERRSTGQVGPTQAERRVQTERLEVVEGEPELLPRDRSVRVGVDALEEVVRVLGGISHGVDHVRSQLIGCNDPVAVRVEASEDGIDLVRQPDGVGVVLAAAGGRVLHGRRSRRCHLCNPRQPRTTQRGCDREGGDGGDHVQQRGREDRRRRRHRGDHPNRDAFS